MFEKYRYIQWAMIAGVLVFFLWGWSSCTSQQLLVSKMKTTRMHTSIAKASIRGTLESTAYLASPGSTEASPRARTWPEIADGAVEAFFNDEGKDPRSFPNPYNREIHGFTRHPAGNEPGVVYIDGSHANKGIVLITGVYIDPSSKKIFKWVEDLKIPGGPVQAPSKQETLPPATAAPIELLQTLPSAPLRMDGRNCSSAIPVDSLDAEKIWLDDNLPGAAFQKRTISHCDQDMVDILTVRVHDGSEREIYFKIRKH